MGAKTLNVGLIGYDFMGRAHSNAYRQVGRFFDLPYQLRLHTLCGRTEGPLRAAAVKLGWEHVQTDWRKLVADPEIDLIDVSTPGDSHCEIAVAAAEAGKAVFCEKPLANSLEEARVMLEVVTSAGVPNAVFHNYRKAPATALARQLVADGTLGEIRHFRAVYLQDWILDPDFPLVWRLRREAAGSGALGDIGSHIIDLARFVVGEIAEVCGCTKTFIEERPIEQGASERGPVTVDDAAAFLAKFENGALGVFEASRMAPGRKNHNAFEINGSRGSVAFDLERMNELQVYLEVDQPRLRGFRTVQATAPEHPYMASYWPPGHIIGYEHTFVNLLADALFNMAAGAPISPNFGDGYKNAAVLEAVQRSVASRAWTKIST